MIKVFILDIEETDITPEFTGELLKYLPTEGRLRVKDRQNNASKLQTVSGELLARYAIGEHLNNPAQEIKLVFGENGKPHIANLNNVHFNISHSGRYIVCAVGPHELGIDVERIRKVNLRIAERYFSASEVSDLLNKPFEEQSSYFITLWTIKESFLKAIGRGLTQHLNSFSIHNDGSCYRLTGNQQAEKYGIVTHNLSDEYLMAACSPLPFSELEIKYSSLKEIIKTLPEYM
jgi:4'-phosphopantetheinyl transferase